VTLNCNNQLGYVARKTRTSINQRCVDLQTRALNVFWTRRRSSYLAIVTCFACIFLVRTVYTDSETYSCKYEKLSNIVIHACKNITGKKIVENVWPANSAFKLFSYVSTHCVKTVKTLDYNRSSQGARGSGFNFRLRQGFLWLFVYCFVVVVFLLLSINTIFVLELFNFFCNVNLFSTRDRIWGFKDTVLAFINIWCIPCIWAIVISG